MKNRTALRSSAGRRDNVLHRESDFMTRLATLTVHQSVKRTAVKGTSYAAIKPQPTQFTHALLTDISARTTFANLMQIVKDVVREITILYKNSNQKLKFTYLNCKSGFLPPILSAKNYGAFGKKQKKAKDGLRVVSTLLMLYIPLTPAMMHVIGC